MSSEIWRVPPVAWPARITHGLAQRARRLFARGRSPSAVGDTPGRGPVFDVSDGPVPFEELEAIVHHPAVIAAIETPPPAPLASATPPPPRLPAGAEALGARRRSRPVRVVDVVPFGIELDLLELRLLHLADLVDLFIVVEDTRGFGGPAKPLFLQRNLARYAPFRDKLLPIVLDAPPPAHLLRQGTDFLLENAWRDAMWRAVRPHVGSDAGTIVVWSDLDELPPRNVLHWVRHHEVPLPMRVRTTTLRYQFGYRDPETVADLVLATAADVAPVPGHQIRHLPWPTFGARGAVHLTSFLPPLALVAKFAMTTDWDPGIRSFVRNRHDEIARMIADGRWFERRLLRYDAETDPDGIVPWAARAHRARFPLWWNDQAT